jgi:hypothetical protein
MKTEKILERKNKERRKREKRRSEEGVEIS